MSSLVDIIAPRVRRFVVLVPLHFIVGYEPITPASSIAAITARPATRVLAAATSGVNAAIGVML